MVEADRTYPWAASGINITSMILNMLNITKGTFYFDINIELLLQRY
jgi:hypothetical protein